MTGISVATISRVMNRSSLVAESTREKVLSALKSSGVDTSEYEMRDTFSNLIVFNVPSLKNIFYSPVISSTRIRIEEKGYTLVPLQVYFKGSLVKVEIGLARGKKLYDKRQDIAKKDMRREAERDLKIKNLY